MFFVRGEGIPMLFFDTMPCRPLPLRVRPLAGHRLRGDGGARKELLLVQQVHVLLVDV